MSCFEQLGEFGRAARGKMGQVWWQFIGVETMLPSCEACARFQVGRQIASLRCSPSVGGPGRNEFARQFIYPPTQRQCRPGGCGRAPATGQCPLEYLRK